jgi:hypothetical protein
MSLEPQQDQAVLNRIRTYSHLLISRLSESIFLLLFLCVLCASALRFAFALLTAGLLQMSPELITHR